MKSAASKNKLFCFLRVPSMPLASMTAIGTSVKDAIKSVTKQDVHVVVTSFELEFISRSELQKLIR